MTKPVLCAGRLYCDLVFGNTPRLPTLGTEVFAPSLTLHAGGGAFITGATLAALGHPVQQLSVLPAPPFDAIVQSDMEKYAVGAAHCAPAAVHMDPQVTVAITTPEDRAFLTHAAGPALPDLDRVDLSRFAHLHISELMTLQENPSLLDHARDAGLTISLDCGWQDGFDPQAAELIAAVDIFLPNTAEFDAILAVGIPETCARLTVVKDGKDGARAKGRAATAWTSRHRAPVTVVDATGAGDAFNAGFLSGWLTGETLETCLDQGNACGAAAVQSPGGAGCLPAQTAES